MFGYHNVWITTVWMNERHLGGLIPGPLCTSGFIYTYRFNFMARTNIPPKGQRWFFHSGWLTNTQEKPSFFFFFFFNRCLVIGKFKYAKWRIKVSSYLEVLFFLKDFFFLNRKKRFFFCFVFLVIFPPSVRRELTTPACSSDWPARGPYLRVF